MKRTELMGWNGQFQKQQTPTQTAEGEIRVVETWAFVMQEGSSGDQIVFAFAENVKDEFIKQLTGGIIIAGGGI